MRFLNGNKIQVFIDGGCWPNPGGDASYSIVAFDDQFGDKTYEGINLRNLIGMDPFMVEISEAVCENSSNNVAEYFALSKFIESIISYNLCNYRITVFSDSMLLVNQMSGQWQVRGGIYKKQYDIVMSMMEKYDLWEIRFIFVKREKNIAGILLEEWQKIRDSGTIKFYSDRMTKECCVK